MDTLDQTEWDVLIVGTGLQQSLLALYVYLLGWSWRTRSD
jgi:RAB protein geranylgeranyltransferase component A